MPIIVNNKDVNCYLCTLLSVFVSLGIVKYIYHLNDGTKLSKFITRLDVDNIKKELHISGMQDVHQIYMTIMNCYKNTSLWDKIRVRYIEDDIECESSYISVNCDKDNISTSSNITETSNLFVLHFKVPICIKNNTNILKTHNYKAKAFIHYSKNHYYSTVVEDNVCYLIDRDIKIINKYDVLEHRTYMIFFKII